MVSLFFDHFYIIFIILERENEIPFPSPSSYEKRASLVFVTEFRIVRLPSARTTIKIRNLCQEVCLKDPPVCQEPPSVCFFLVYQKLEQHTFWLIPDRPTWCVQLIVWSVQTRGCGNHRWKTLQTTCTVDDAISSPAILRCPVKQKEGFFLFFKNLLSCLCWRSSLRVLS